MDDRSNFWNVLQIFDNFPGNPLIYPPGLIRSLFWIKLTNADGFYPQ